MIAQPLHRRQEALRPRHQRPGRDGQPARLGERAHPVEDVLLLIRCSRPAHDVADNVGEGRGLGRWHAHLRRDGT